MLYLVCGILLLLLGQASPSSPPVIQDQLKPGTMLHMQRILLQQGAHGVVDWSEMVSSQSPLILHMRPTTHGASCAVRAADKTLRVMV